VTNLEKLEQLFVDVFLLAPGEWTLTLSREDVDTWDSLGVVSLGVGIQETFGYHPTAEEAVALRSVDDVIALLETHGVHFKQ
jgi:acyl carrier protein